MRKVNYLIALAIAGASLLSSCGDDEEPTPIELSVTGVPTITIDENPSNGEVLATLEGTANRGELVFSLSDQNPAGAMAIDAATGKLTVADASKFDFETNPTLTAIGNITVEGVTKSTDLVVNLQNVDEPDDAVLAYYKFDGSNADEKGVKDFEIRGATPTQGVNGLASSAYKTGLNKYLGVDSSLIDITEDFSIALWLKADNVREGLTNLIGSRKDFLAGNEQGGIDFLYEKNGNTETVDITARRTGGTLRNLFNKTYTLNLSDKAWHHLAFTRAGNNYKFYVDGSLIGSFTSSELLQNGTSWVLSEDPTRRYFEGSFDQLRFYQKAISGELINKMVNDKI